MGTYSGGAGTVGDPYQIATQADLVELSANATDMSAYFKQTADIDLATETGQIQAFGSGQFLGEYDGDYHSIRNYTKPAITASMVGLFGNMHSATVKNLIIDNFHYSGKTYDSFGFVCGSVVGPATLIENVCVINSTMNLDNDGASGHDNIGFLIGAIEDDASVKKCFIKNCTMTLSNAGATCQRYGLMAGSAYYYTYLGLNFDDCFVHGEIICNDSDYIYVGGFAGRGRTSITRGVVIAALSGSNLPSSYKDAIAGLLSQTTTTNVFYESGIWDGESEVGTAKTTAEMQTQSTFTSYDFDTVWKMGTDGYPTLQWFSGLNIPTIEEEYTVGNQDADENMGSSQTYIAAAQTFTATNNKVITSSKFYVKKFGSPTGDMISRLYLTTGTVGTDAVPTGSPLVSSDAVAISGITTDYQLIEFDFSTKYKLTSGVDYAITLEYNGGDPSNYLIVGVDESSPVGKGAKKKQSDNSWETSLVEYIFYLYAEEDLYGVTLNTNAATDITDESAIISGDITDAGLAGTDNHIYLEWGETVTDNSIDKSTGGVATYTSTLTGLEPATTYYFRIKVTNVGGVIYYGDTLNFTTEAAPSLGGFTKIRGFNKMSKMNRMGL